MTRNPDLDIRAFLILAQKVQDLRLQIMESAADGHPPRKALEESLRKAGEFFKVKRKPSDTIPDISEEDYLFLERRLRNLRRFIINRASRLAMERAGKESCASKSLPHDVVVMPADIERAWQEAPNSMQLLTEDDVESASFPESMTTPADPAVA